MGFEDIRLFSWQGELWCSSTVRELTEECGAAGAGAARPARERIVPADGLVGDEFRRRHEKNWMPKVTDRALHFIYGCDPAEVVDHRGDP